MKRDSRRYFSGCVEKGWCTLVQVFVEDVALKKGKNKATNHK